VNDEPQSLKRPRRIFRMTQRKSFWMYDYDQVKYRTPVHWGASLILSVIFSVFGCVVLWAVVGEYKSKHELDTGLIAIAVMCLGLAIIELPASVIFFYRRLRGEITGYFDYEVAMEADRGSINGVNHGSDHR
jgi:hypothetical protein